MKRGFNPTLVIHSKLVVRLLLFGLGVFSACSNNHKAEHPVVANIQLEKTLLAVSVVADSLDVPWDFQFINSNQLIYTEIAGKIGLLDLQTGEKKLLYTVNDVYHKRTLGLLGMALHPNFERNPYVYISYTIKKDSLILSRLERLTFQNDSLTNPTVLHTIAGNSGHNGARITFTNDGKLLWATGDAHSKTFAQDSTALNGKILRMNSDGSVPKDNPINGSLVYAWGFRNMQGLTVSDNGTIYTSEHGDAIEDEINRIMPLRNYGWPEIEGKHDTPAELAIAEHHQRTEPIKSWTPVIAPAGLKYYNSKKIPEWQNSLLLVTLKSQSLRVLNLSANGREVYDEWVYLEKVFGRIRAVNVSPGGDVYIATSNKDWNPQPGFPKADDDKILKLSPAKKATHKPLTGVKSIKIRNEVQDGATLYNSYCASCHKENGLGIENTFPPLAGAEQVTGESSKLIDIVLKGFSGEITVKGKKYDQQMPAFNFLKDEEVANILTYIRKNFGNNSEAISPNDISKQRK
jgi:glucose/arabinose dehydrogenase